MNARFIARKKEYTEPQPSTAWRGQRPDRRRTDQVKGDHLQSQAGQTTRHTARQHPPSKTAGQHGDTRPPAGPAQ
jgi:hypothetical protein